MSHKPRREIATLHNDVLRGAFKQSEFTANTVQLAIGTAPTEYQDSELCLAGIPIAEYRNYESGPFARQTGNFDADTQFRWFEQYGRKNSPFGEADVLARAKGTSVDGIVGAGVLASGAGRVRLLKWKEYPADWDPARDDRTPVWEALHHMIRRLNEDNEAAAGELLARMPEKGEPLRQLAYHLYTLCERAGWAEDARAYNELIGAWHAIVTASHEVGHKCSQAELNI